MTIQFNHQIGPSDQMFQLLSQMTRLSIAHHEKQIELCTTEEDISHREARIMELQRSLSHLRTAVAGAPKQIEFIAKIDQ